MPIIMESREEGHLLYVGFSDPWTLSEMESMFKKEQELRDASKFTMHTLINVKDLHRIHPAFVSVARRTPTFHHPRRGHVAIVGAIAFVQALAETLSRITPGSNMHFFTSEEPALKYLQKVIADEAAKNTPSQPGEVPTAGPSM